MGAETDFDRMHSGQSERRRYVKFDPTLQVGTIVEILVIVVGIALAWGTLKSDQQLQRSDIDSIKKGADEQKLVSKEALAEIRGDVKEVQRTLNQVNTTLAGIEARQQPQKGKP